ncbi:MAG TPA: chemotaxis protein CheD [Acidisarcina sp.]|nr:chemotaxis protein CheD [Acidisarcina sp.]
MRLEAEGLDKAASITVGVGDCQVSNNPDASLVTYALGSCMAVTIYDPMARVGGMLHYMLPDSRIDQTKASQRPWMFADTGIPLLFRWAYRLGAVKSRLLVAAVGGAQMVGTDGVFDIGKRNQLALRRIFWKAGVLVHCEEVGGNLPRTLWMNLGNGRILLRHAQQDRELRSLVAEERKAANDV